MRKKVSIGAKPKASNRPKQAADAWVAGRGEHKMKRLTIDVSEDLHRRIKMGCAERGVKMADEIRSLLESAFSADR